MNDNISELSIEQLKKENESLKREIKAALMTIDRLLKDLSQKTEEIKHLQSLVNQTVPIVVKESKNVDLSITPEEEIAAVQLERLRNAARNRTLTLEEIRAFDLLVKNKRLSQDESTINLSKSDYREITDATLLQIAGKNESDDTDNHS